MRRLLLPLFVFTYACGAAPKPEPLSALPSVTFIEDDYPRALAKARATKRPLFVDAWAEWCHTCLSLRAFVFPDPAISKKAGDFVWAAIDTEKPANAGFVSAHPMEAWPTLWVIDPSTETAVLRWNGSATATELASLLDDAKLAMSRGDSGGQASAAYLRGNQETAAGKTNDAIVSYRLALAAAPHEWPKRARVVEALSSRLKANKDYEGCLALAALELPRMAPGTNAKSVAQDAIECLMSVPAGAGRAHEAEVLAAAERIAKDPRRSMLADDRSDLYGAIVEGLTFLKRSDDAKRLARDWVALLEREAANATSPAARVVFDSHRYDAYRALGEPERAVPMLTQSERDLPNDYNPPARLAGAYFAMDRYDDALAAIDRALARAYGPRKLRFYALKADILAKNGDKAAERATVDQALDHARGLVLMGSILKVKAALEERKEKLR